MRRSLAVLWPHLETAVPAFKHAPLIADFQLTAEEAKHSFLAHQRQSPLAPNNPLSPDHTIIPLYLPFWLFTVHAAVQASARAATQASDGSTLWRTVTSAASAQQNPGQIFPNTLLSTQVCAAYTYRRDYMEAMKLGTAQQALLRPLTAEEMLAGESRNRVVGKLELEWPEMKQAIGWEFALRGIRHEQANSEIEKLKTEFKAQEVSDVRIKLKPMFREVQLAYLPVYQLSYTFGETFNVHGERKPERFLALISGLKGGGVAAERHFSSAKASTFAAATFVALAGGINALSGVPPTQLLTIENAFLTLITGWTAALSTRLIPVLYQQRLEDQRMRAETEEYDKVLSLGMGPLDPGSDEGEAIRSDVEWTRWEQSDLKTWSRDKRRQWAESLWKSQHQRRSERQQLRQRLQQEEARREQEEEREHRRRKRWGHSSHHHHGARHSLGTSGMREGLFIDPLGYYKVLGLDASTGSVSQAAIKKAFRQLALRWHPDRHHADDSKKRHAKETFHLIKTAYDCLSDPKQKEMYDRGEKVQ